MVTWFKFIVFLHVVSAVVWVGSAIVLEILKRKPQGAHDRQEILAGIRRADWFGAHVFGPAAIATILTGILGVIVGRPAFADFWVIVGIVAVAADAVVGSIFIGRSMAKLAKLAENPNVPQLEIEDKLAQTKPFTFLSLAILLFVLFDMVMRPATPDRNFIIITIAYFALVAIAVFIQRGKSRQSIPAA